MGQVCHICMERKTSTQIFTNGDVCAHSFCKGCVANYITVKVEADGAATVKCPAVNCRHSLDVLSCRPIIPAHLFERWSRLLCQATFEGSDACYCPNNYCSELIIKEIGGLVEGSSHCPNCKEMFCFQCRMAWQEGHRCDTRRTSGDLLFEQLAASKKWARCPVCHHCVERTKGCSSIKCRCGSSFCYDCGKEGFHKGDCKAGKQACCLGSFVLLIIIPLAIFIPLLVITK